MNNYNPYFGYNFGFQYIVPEKRQIRSLMAKVGGALLLAFALMQVISTVLFLVSTMLSPVNMDALSSDMTNMITGISSVAAMVAAAGLLSATTNTAMEETVFMKKVPLKELIWLLFGGAAVCTVANYAVEILISIIGFGGVDISGGGVLESDEVNSVLSGVLLFVSTAIIPPLAEELLFRGVILGVLKKFGNTFAIVVSAVLFGMLHGNFVQIPFAFIVGLVLAFVTIYSGSLIPAILIHFYNNGTAVLQQILYNRMSEGVFNVTFVLLSIATLILGIAGVIFLAKKDKSILKVTDGCDTVFENSFGKRIRIALTSPVIVIFLAVMVALSMYMVTL